jgi:hypothetical protein
MQAVILHYLKNPKEMEQKMKGTLREITVARERALVVHGKKVQIVEGEGLDQQIDGLNGPRICSILAETAGIRLPAVVRKSDLVHFGTAYDGVGMKILVPFGW